MSHKNLGDDVQEFWVAPFYTRLLSRVRPLEWPSLTLCHNYGAVSIALAVPAI